MTPEQPAQAPPQSPPTLPPAPRAEVQWEVGGKSIHPVLDFDLERRLAFVCVPLPLREGEGNGKTRQSKPYLVVTGPGFKNLVPLELANIPLDAEPVFIEPTSRWPQSHLRSFLDGTAPAATGAEVFSALVDVIGRYVDTADPVHNKLLGLFVMMSYIFPAFPTVCYLKLSGPRASGKTRLASILSMVCHNALHTSSLTPASIFRVTQGTRCTLIADEMEGLGTNSQLSTLLNGGYKRGAMVVRAGTKGKLDLFQSYGPKVIASIEPLNDVLASRTLLVSLTPTKDAAKARLAVTEASEDWGRLRSQLYSWAMTHWHDAATVVLPESAGISNRLAELWAPLLSIAATLEPQKQGLVAELVGYAARSMAPTVPRHSFTEAEQAVLGALARLAGQGRPAELTPAAILAAAAGIPGAAGLTTNGLGTILRRWELFRSRRHASDGQRYGIDWGRVVELGGA